MPIRTTAETEPYTPPLEYLRLYLTYKLAMYADGFDC